MGFKSAKWKEFYTSFRAGMAAGTSLRQQLYSCFGGGCTWWWENHGHHKSLAAFKNQNHLKKPDGCFTLFWWHIWPLAHARIRSGKCLCLSLPSYKSCTGCLSPLKSDLFGSYSDIKTEGHWLQNQCKSEKNEVCSSVRQSVILNWSEHVATNLSANTTCSDQKYLGRMCSLRCETSWPPLQQFLRLQGQTSSICFNVLCSISGGQLWREPTLLSHQLCFCLCASRKVSAWLFFLLHPPQPK